MNHECKKAGSLHFVQSSLKSHSLWVTLYTPLPNQSSNPRTESDTKKHDFVVNVLYIFVFPLYIYILFPLYFLFPIYIFSFIFFIPYIYLSCKLQHTTVFTFQVSRLGYFICQYISFKYIRHSGNSGLFQTPERKTLQWWILRSMLDLSFC